MSKQKIFLIAVVIGLMISCTNPKGEENFEHLQNIKIGMEMNEVHSIMPNTPVNLKQAYWSDTLLVESYESGFGASDYYKIIYFKKDSVVFEIKWGD